MNSVFNSTVDLRAAIFPLLRPTRALRYDKKIQINKNTRPSLKYESYVISSNLFRAGTSRALNWIDDDDNNNNNNGTRT